MSYMDPTLPVYPLMASRPRSAVPTVPLIDPSLDTPDQQFQYLVDIIELADELNPAPFTGTPPGDEYIEPDQVIPTVIEQLEYMPPADMDAAAAADELSRFRDAYPNEYPGSDWVNDPQYFGLGVPPGVPNWDQPYESGHTQIVRQNPAAEQGWDAWSGRAPMARVARQFSDNPFYSRGTSRGHELDIEKFEVPYVLQTQQQRDLLLSELKRRGVHSVVVADVASVPWTEQVVAVDPMALVPEAPIGPAGVLP
jgi:hypothetical protein